MENKLTKREERRPETLEQHHWVSPAVDIYENEAEWLILADVPGVAKDGLTLHLEQRELVIEGKRGDAEKIGWTGYRRTFALPSGVDGAKVAAELDRGVVQIHLPKSEAIKPRRIAISAS